VLGHAAVDAAVKVLGPDLWLVAADGGIDDGEEGVRLGVVYEMAFEVTQCLGCAERNITWIIGHWSPCCGTRMRMSPMITAKVKAAPTMNSLMGRGSLTFVFLRTVLMSGAEPVLRLSKERRALT
jgi:hypothetical protein